MKQTDLPSAAREKILLVAHRGAFGGDLPCNTIPAFELALSQGADMIELDVDRTADGVLVIFHPWMEKAQLGYADRIARHPWDFVKQLRYVNFDDCPTPFGIERFDDVLDRFKGRCFLNIDKFWEHPEEIARALRDHGMQEQALVKSGPNPRVLEITERFCPDLPFMGIARTEADVAACRARKLRYVGTEVLFADEASPLASPAFLEAQHREGLLVWANAIVYDHREQLAAGRSDDRAVCGDPEGSWGWLADRGFDFIQTDWTRELALFLEKTGRRSRSGNGGRGPAAGGAPNPAR